MSIIRSFMLECTLNLVHAPSKAIFKSAEIYEKNNKLGHLFSGHYNFCLPHNGTALILNLSKQNKPVS